MISRLTDIASEESTGSVERIDGVGRQPPRYFLHPETGAKVIYRQHRQAITPADRDDTIADRAQELAKTGPFDEMVFVDADRSPPADGDRRDIATTTLLDAGIDDARKNRLIVRRTRAQPWAMACWMRAWMADAPR